MHPCTMYIKSHRQKKNNKKLAQICMLLQLDTSSLHGYSCHDLVVTVG